MKRIFLTVAVLFSLVAGKAQFTYDYLKAADNYYKSADYFSAARYYEKYLEAAGGKGKKEAYNPYTAQASSKKSVVTTDSRQQAVYNLAESYRLLNYHVKAEAYYKQAVDFNKTEYPLSTYYYAVTLRALEKYDEAEKAFVTFLDEYKTTDQYSDAARREVMNLRFIREQLNKKDLGLYTVQKATEPLNTKGANYAPAWLNDGTLLFTSTRADSSAGKKHVYVNRLYQAAYSEGVTGNISKVSLPQAGNMHQGVVSVSPDGTTLFLTRWTLEEGKKTSAIYSSSISGSGWTEPAMLDAAINTPGYNTQQPFVMPGGKYLIYASDKPGGFGGFDLWYAELDANGKPMNPQNMGSAINTAHDEQAPFYHQASGTLVFSGNGRIGMGGYDFFYSKGNIGAWAEPVNFGYPVNSVKDDIYFTSRGGAKNILEDVVLSSDRTAECCLELFSLSKARPLRQVSGQVVACGDKTPLPGALVKIVDANNKTVFSKTTAPDGSYSFSLEDFQPLRAVASLQGYSNGSLEFYTPADEEAITLVNPSICLVKDAPPVEAVIVLENVYYDFDKAVLREESYPELDKLVTMMNEHPDMVIEISAHTDNKGSDAYNLKLSEARAKSVVTYLISKGIDQSRLQSKGYGASMPVAPNQNPDGTDNPEGRQQNRRTEFKVLKNGE